MFTFSMGDFDWIEEVKMKTDLEYPESWSHKKLSRKDARRFKHLTYKHFFKNVFDKEEILEILSHTHLDKKTRKDYSERLEILYLKEKYDISDRDFRILINMNSDKYDSNRVDYYKRPKREGRDNKGVYVGGGGSNRNMVRYPSKKRSKKVWKTFYKMFPYCARRDGWDGVKSSRIDFTNRKNK